MSKKYEIVFKQSSGFETVLELDLDSSELRVLERLKEELDDPYDELFYFEEVETNET